MIRNITPPPLPKQHKSNGHCRRATCKKLRWFVSKEKGGGGSKHRGYGDREIKWG